MTIKTIAFDADDTLWHNEIYYTNVKDKFKELFSGIRSPEWISKKIDEVELENFNYYGYGIKGFALSLIETAVDLNEGEVQGQQIKEIITSIKGMLMAEVPLMDHAADTVGELAPKYDLMIITKGDTFEQKRKVARSGLAEYFRFTEVVVEKNIRTYQALLKRYHIKPEQFMMVGNSLRSDIAPVLSIGGTAVYIDYPSTWFHETTFIPAKANREYLEIEHLGQLPDLIKDIKGV
jgi:putative hydrolase of the HAD superfamily